jgi:DHA1 family bicyclomycin/chloramphenicol resistance-like MFS transporter
MIFVFGLGPLFPLTTMRAMQPFAERAGSASSLLGCVQLAFGAFVGFLIGLALERWASAMPLAVALAVLGCGAVVIDRRTPAERTRT